MMNNEIKKNILRGLIHFAKGKNLLYRKSHIKAVEKDCQYLIYDESIDVMYSYCGGYFDGKINSEIKQTMKWVFDMFNFFNEEEKELTKFLKDPDKYDIDSIDICKYNRDKYINKGEIVRLNLLTEWNYCHGNRFTFKAIFVKLT